ncbi:MAG: hypothetical protein JNK82_20135 [Myxococcaceae bacterium]|nr:hypothetical protein [Myxococcaceae bacterium]
MGVTMTTMMTRAGVAALMLMGATACFVPLDVGTNDGGGGGGAAGGSAGGTAGGAAGGSAGSAAGGSAGGAAGGGAGGAAGGSAGGAAGGSGGGASGSGCACRSGAYVVNRTQGLQQTWVVTVSDCAGALSCTINGQPRTCMDTPDGVFRIYVDGAGFQQLIFSSQSCTASWQGVYASEGGGTAALTTARAEADAGVLCAPASGLLCAGGLGCVDDPTDTCRGAPDCAGWCMLTSSGTPCAGFTCRDTELCKRQQPGIPGGDAGPFELGCVPATGACATATCGACFTTDPCATMCQSVSLDAGARTVDCMGI